MGCQHHLLVITLALLAAMEAPAVSSAAEESSGVPTTGQADTGAGAAAEASSGAPANPSPDVSPAPSPGDTSAPSSFEQRKPTSEVPRVAPQPPPSVSYQSDDEGTGRLGEPGEQDDPLPSKTAARWMLTLDHLAMVGAWTVMHTEQNVEITESGTQAIFVGGSAATGSIVPINPHATPRLTLEHLIGSRFTIGLGASLYRQSGDWEARSGAQSASGDGAKNWLVSLTPRIGYQFPVTDDAGIGFRAGITWSQQSERSPLVRSNVKLGTFDFALSWTYWMFEHLGAVASFDLCLPIGGIRYLDYDKEFASKLGVEPHAEDNLKLRVIALQLGAQARF